MVCVALIVGTHTSKNLLCDKCNWLFLIGELLEIAQTSVNWFLMCIKGKIRND